MAESMGFLKSPWAGLGGLAVGGLASLMAPNAMQATQQNLGQMDKRYTSPGALGGRINSFYNIGQASPAYTNALRMIFGNQARQTSALSTSLGRSGLSKSAAATAAKTLADSGASSAVGNLNAGFYGMAQDQAFQSLQMLLNSTPQGMDWKRLFTGATIGAMGDMLYQGSKN